MSKKMKGCKGRKWTALEKATATLSRTGATRSEEAKVRMAKAQLDRVRRIFKCPHCPKESTANMHRYHFDNCKHAPK